MIPKDPVILLSFVNTKLRDGCGSVEELCQACDCSAEDITKALNEIDYFYDSRLNQFILI